MATTDFYEDRRYCPHCAGYVRYLLSLHSAYCVECGGTVQLFSQQDRVAFQSSLSDQRRRFGAVQEEADQPA